MPFPDSGNDAAIALAEHAAGSQEAFASLMNNYAAQIGMKGSHFVNAHGLSAPEHYSTAYDLALLGRAFIRDYPEQYAYNKIKEFTVGPITQPNRNLLLWRDASVDGIKTGHHSGAGYCLMASAKRGDQRLISVVLGDSSEEQRAVERAGRHGLEIIGAVDVGRAVAVGRPNLLQLHETVARRIFRAV